MSSAWIEKAQGVDEGPLLLDGHGDVKKWLGVSVSLRHVGVCFGVCQMSSGVPDSGQPAIQPASLRLRCDREAPAVDDASLAARAESFQGHRQTEKDDDDDDDEDDAFLSSPLLSSRRHRHHPHCAR